jgi:hypothetical protein
MPLTREFFHFGCKLLHPEPLSTFTASSPYFHVSLAIPRNFAVKVVIASPSGGHPFSTFDVSYTPIVNNSILRRCDVQMVFPHRGAYWVVISGKSEASGEIIRGFPLMEILIECDNGIFDIIDQKDVFVGYLSRLPSLGTLPNNFNSHFYLLQPTKGYFLIGHEVPVMVAMSPQMPVERMVLSGTSLWSDLKPRLATRGPTAGMVIWEGHILVESVADITIRCKVFERDFESLWSFNQASGPMLTDPTQAVMLCLSSQDLKYRSKSPPNRKPRSLCVQPPAAFKNFHFGAASGAFQSFLFIGRMTLGMRNWTLSITVERTREIRTTVSKCSDDNPNFSQAVVCPDVPCTALLRQEYAEENTLSEHLYSLDFPDDKSKDLLRAQMKNSDYMWDQELKTPWIVSKQDSFRRPGSASAWELAVEFPTTGLYVIAVDVSFPGGGGFLRAFRAHVKIN